MSATPLISDPRPWAFSRSELTAGLRAYVGDPTLSILDIQEQDIPYRRPAIGRLRGLKVTCKSAAGERVFELVLKEPQGTTRAGTAGAGRREVLFYRTMSVQLPVRVPQLLATHPEGNWLVLNLLPESIPPENWTAEHYRFAVEQLVVLHDRFWGLGDDLAAYAWLARPLGSDYSIFMQAARYGVRRLVDKVTSNLITRDQSLVRMLKRLVEHADLITAALRTGPATLLHGDYWPGNIALYPDNTITVYDWQQAAIGPGILDLFHFVQASQWYLGALPVTAEELGLHYRASLQGCCGQRWTDTEWALQWDYALLWTFLCSWVDLLANIPAAVLQARYQQIRELWLIPVEAAMDRRLPR
jgi:hypothetical protein